MSSAGGAAAPATAPDLAAEAALLGATAAALSAVIRRGRRAELGDLAGRVAALCAALTGSAGNPTRTHQLLGLLDELQQLVAGLDADVGALRRELDVSSQRLAAARAYRMRRTDPP